MRKFIVAAFVLVALFATGAVTASAQDDDQPVASVDDRIERIDPVPVEPTPIAPLPWGSIHLRGDVWANGHPIGPIDFGLVWNEDDPSEAQLWALLGNVPTQVCIGRIFDTPLGEPIFFGTTSLMTPAGTCHMARLPNHSGVTLFAASDDGQWASAILKFPNQVKPVPIFES